MGAKKLRIDRLTLSLPGRSVADGRRVGELVAAGLARAGVAPEIGDLPNLRLTVAAPKGARAETLARQIVDQILLALAKRG